MAFQNPGQRQLQEMQERARKQQEEQRHRMEMAWHYKKRKEEEDRLRAQQQRPGSVAAGGTATRIRGGETYRVPRGLAVGSTLRQPTLSAGYTTHPQGHPIRALLLLPVLLVVVALVGIATGWIVEYGVNLGDTASIVAAGAFWIVGGLWALGRSMAVWRGD